MKKIFFLAFFLSLYGTESNAQPKFVTLPNGGMVPCDHPLAIAANLGCTNRVTVTDYDCSSYINPYAEPERAAFCAAKTIKPVEQNGIKYEVGKKYYHAYASNRMVVLGITRDIFNRPVVTYQWYQGFHLGEVWSFIVGVTEQPFTEIKDEEEKD